MTPLLVLWSAFMLGLITSISPCPLATNIAAISFLGRSVGNARTTLLSGLLYTLGRVVVYAGLGMAVLFLVQGGTDSAASGISMFLQRYMGMMLGPALILTGMLLVGLLEFSVSVNLGGQGLQRRVERGGALWAFPLGVLFALSFCPVSASLFFAGLIGLSSQHASPVLLPVLFGVGTALPVIGFAFLIAFAGRYVGKAFDNLTKLDRWLRLVTGGIFIAVGFYYTLTHIYGVSFRSP
jgi:cytochrome c-type biogenesis protein